MSFVQNFSVGRFGLVDHGIGSRTPCFGDSEPYVDDGTRCGDHSPSMAIPSLRARADQRSLAGWSSSLEAALALDSSASSEGGCCDKIKNKVEVRSVFKFQFVGNSDNGVRGRDSMEGPVEGIGDLDNESEDVTNYTVYRENPLRCETDYEQSENDSNVVARDAEVTRKQGMVIQVGISWYIYVCRE